MRGDRLGAGVVDDPAPQQVPHVGTEAVAPALVAVERQREALPLRDPDVLQEPLAQGAGLALESRREPGVVPDLAGQPGGAQLRVVRVALNLTARDRSLGEA